MVKIIDRTLGALLAIGGLWHAWSSFTTFVFLSPMLVWAWSGSVAAVLVAALNLLRVARPDDRAVAWISFAGCLLWLAIVALFAATLFDLLDVRLLYHGLVTVALGVLSLRTALGRATASAARPPVPETSRVPETPAAETPSSETPSSETPSPETSSPGTPSPETKSPETPAPETPPPEAAVAKPKMPEVSPS